MSDFASPTQTSLRRAATDTYRHDETEAVQDMLQRAQMSDERRQVANTLARRLAVQVRVSRIKVNGVNALIHEFFLSSKEGTALMCLAEALLRVPDKTTCNKLITDELSDGDWKKHLNNSPSLSVNATAWGLLVIGKLTTQTNEQNLSAALNRLLGKDGEPLTREGVDYAIRLLGKQFVTRQTIEEALQNGRECEKMGHRYSFDMLDEAAYTQAGADRYYNDYMQAIHAIGEDAVGQGVYEGSGISVKLFAIRPHYPHAQHERVTGELLPRLKELYLLGKKYNIGVDTDAREANRLELSLGLMEALVPDPNLAGYNGTGFAVQTHQKRCPFTINYPINLARRNNQKLMIHLIKGAYWDSEIKWTQVDGLNGCPVYTRKVHTDISYPACARKLLSVQDAVFSQFAAHSTHTLAAIYQMGKGKDFEHQRLRDMGEMLYDQAVEPQNLDRRMRTYAPVGAHEALLAYLIHRLLEGGTDSSLASQIVGEEINIDQLTRGPFGTIAGQDIRLHAALPLSYDLYGKGHLDSQGFDLNNENVLQQLQQELNRTAVQQFQTASVVNGKSRPVGTGQQVRNPADHSDIVGPVSFTGAALVQEAVAAAVATQAAWNGTPAAERAARLHRSTDLLERHVPVFMMLIAYEADKTLNNATAEVHEAVDFYRYYTDRAEHALPQGSQDVGTIVAISPWNFPSATFTDEMITVLAAGNAVIAKPAEQASLTAGYAVSLMREAGIPTPALQLVLGVGGVGAALMQDSRIDSMVLTGSTEAARLINQTLAERDDSPILIAETGGQSAMIADSTVLTERVCVDVFSSAFDSTGQRCSALHILYVQEDVTDHMVEMIEDAIDELVVDNPTAFSTDIGPVVDTEAQ